MAFGMDLKLCDHLLNTKQAWPAEGQEITQPA
jgi:hypothetical protein